MRLDKLLWFLRFTRTRPQAQELAEAGHIRLNGRRVERSAQAIQVGDVLVLPLPAAVRVIEILAIPPRRGPASEAQSCYRALDAGPEISIAASSNRPGATRCPEHGPEHQGDHLP
ncbi:RNA-binding S4 domain-containing protein [Novosphingobium bradum]|uniref:RNA-binding S4 domain-containing protein n=1 Tax=Novosphingobium bradum TaxID=1737444 RepID=A0ABV7IU71_9SPHN